MRILFFVYLCPPSARFVFALIGIGSAQFQNRNDVSVFFHVAGAARGQEKVKNENLEPIVNGTE